MFTYYTQEHKILSDTISYYLFSDDASIRELCSILEGFLKHAEHIVEHSVDILIPICKKSLAELKTFEANTTRGSDAAALASQCIIHADRFMEFMETKVDNKKEIQTDDNNLINMKPTFISLEIHFEIEQVKTGSTYAATNIGVILNPDDNQYYLNFDIDDLGMRDINLPLSYLKNQEESFRNNSTQPHFLNQKKYSSLFHKRSDNSAAYFQAFGEQLNMYDAFSVSLFAHEQLEGAIKNISGI